MTILGRILTRGVLPLGLVACGAGGAAAMIFGAPGADSGEPEKAPTPVEVVPLEPISTAALVRVNGTVQADQQVALSPEVQGRVTWVSPDLHPGGRFEEGETLLKVDAQDYVSALAAEEARLAQARLELALEEKRQLTARREVELLGAQDEADSLTLREPHLEVARANVKSAEAAVARARKNLARTRLQAPFNAIVVSEQTDLGQFAGPSTQAVTLVGTDAVRVVASVPVEELSVLDIPGVNAELGSPARVSQDLTDEARVVRPGRLTGVSGELDGQTRTAQVTVRVETPISGQEPLLPGAFVEVELVGRTLDGVVAVPRAALDGTEAVWVAADDTLQRREVQVGWRTEDHVYVTDGLEPGDRAVVTALAQPVQGMPVAAEAQVAQMGGE
jgi:RND family efflux transporter MFP subunit